MSWPYVFWPCILARYLGPVSFCHVPSPCPGPQSRLIDDVTGTLPPYDQFITLGPVSDASTVLSAALAWRMMSVLFLSCSVYPWRLNTVSLLLAVRLVRWLGLPASYEKMVHAVWNALCLRKVLIERPRFCRPLL